MPPEIIGREADILDFLWEGPKTTKEIAKHLALHESSARKHLKPLRVQGKIVAIHQGYYRLSEELAPWTELKNQKNYRFSHEGVCKILGAASSERGCFS